MKIHFFTQQSSHKGFTLIELLVVIGILGILAAALVATLDPFEQLRKAQDANTKNIAVEFIDASTRYYTTHNLMMWGVDTANCSTVSGPNKLALTAANATPCLTDLINDGEIKAGFTTATGALGQITITGTTNSVTACFLPQSKSGKNDANTRYTVDGTLLTTCIGTPGGTDTNCYWCSL